MIVTKMALPRRTFLRGAGTILALPLLDAMVPALTTVAKAAPFIAPPRIGYFYVPNGMHMATWKPRTTGVGNNWQLSQTLKSLDSVKEYVTVLGNLNNYAAGIGDGGGPHTRNQSAWLTGARARTGESEPSLATSADQYAARFLGKDTVLESLELATDPNDQVGSCDNDYSCLYVNTLSWRSATVPNPMERNPRVVFERLFGEESEKSARLARMRADKSILDGIRGDLASLGVKIGVSDRTKVNEYLDSVREVEARIQKAEKQGMTSDVALIARPMGVPETFEEHTLLMLNLIFLAYQADLTRVVTFMIVREQGSRSYPNIGVPEGHHECSHHQNDPHKLEQLAKINSYHVSLMKQFYEKMAAAKEGDGTLLDHAALVYGAGQSDGDLHSPLDLPALLVGKLNGTIKGNQNIDYDPARKMPFMNLHLSLLHKAGLPQEKFGDATGTLSEI
jgi:hypothetical protein